MHGAKAQTVGSDVSAAEQQIRSLNRSPTFTLSLSLSLSAISDFRRVGSIKWWAHGVLRAVRLSFRIDAEIERPIGVVRSWSCSHNAAVWPVKTVVHSLCAE